MIEAENRGSGITVESLAVGAAERRHIMSSFACRAYCQQIIPWLALQLDAAVRATSTADQLRSSIP